VLKRQSPDWSHRRVGALVSAARSLGATPGVPPGRAANLVFPFKSFILEPLAKLQWCDEFSTGMSGTRGVRGVLG
jgi:hypothetical protein